MKKQLFLYLSAFCLVFASCEEHAPAPQIQESLSHKEAQSKMKAPKVLNFRAHLSGDQEVPAVETNATGQAIFKLSKDSTQLYYKLIAVNIENVRMAHIHVAPPGENGGVVVWLYPNFKNSPELIPGRSNGILSEGIITKDKLVGALAGAELSDLIELMVAGGTYVNIHTLQVPSGEIRGQVIANNY